uniref:Fibronectin type-III domain-containing protein n=1 Tax=Electrophorus electricus TaxID=8005 RepID=A0AAY5ERY1_ELEEL
LDLSLDLCMNLPAPVNTYIYSHNFVHLLTWEPGSGSPEETCFTVLVRSLRYRTKWTTVRNCALVRSPLQCNLTDEFSNPEETYYTNVSAHLGNQISAPVSCPAFQPLKDTILEPPLLKVSQCNQSLCVQLQPPSPRLFSVYNSPLHGFQYKLHVTVNGEDEFWMTTKGLNDVVLKHLPPGQEYCVSVGIVHRRTTNRPAVCILTTVAVPNSGAAFSVALSLLTLLCGMCCFLLWSSGFFCLTTHLPSVLSSFKKPYTESLLSWSFDGSITSISVEPRANEEEAEGMAGEEEDAGVVYEGRQSHTLSGEEASEMGSFSSSGSPVWNRSPYMGASDDVLETQASPVQVGEASCCTAPTEEVLPPPCKTSFQWKPEVPKATSQALDIGVLEPESGMRELRQKHTSAFRLAHGTEVKGGVNINLSSLTLGGHWGEKEKIPEEMRTGCSGNNIQVESGVLSSLHRASDVAQNSQRTCSLNSSSNMSGAEEEEEMEDSTGYLQRN